VFIKGEALKRRQAVSFQIGVCSDPHLWSLILCKKRYLMCKRPRWGFCEEFTSTRLRNTPSPECRTTSPNRDIPATTVRSRDQNAS